MKAIISTWKTLMGTLSVVGQSSSYYPYPLLSFISMLLATFTIMIPLLDRVLEIGNKDVPTLIILFLVVYFMYGVLYFVTTFFNVALVNSIAGRLDADDTSLIIGISEALQRIGAIALYTLVSATQGLVSILARMLNPFLGGVIAPFIGNRLWVRWYQLSYSIPRLMAVPVIALDQPVPGNVLNRSGLLVKATWGERVKPAHSIGLLALLILLPIAMLFALPALRQGSAEHDAGLIRLGSSVLLVAILIFTQVNALVNAIFALAAYRYATARRSDVFPGDPSYAEHAFVKPKKETGEDAALTTLISDTSPAIADDPSN